MAVASGSSVEAGVSVAAGSSVGAGVAVASAKTADVSEPVELFPIAETTPAEAKIIEAETTLQISLFVSLKFSILILLNLSVFVLLASLNYSIIIFNIN